MTEYLQNFRLNSYYFISHILVPFDILTGLFYVTFIFWLILNHLILYVSVSWSMFLVPFDNILSNTMFFVQFYSEWFLTISWTMFMVPFKFLTDHCFMNLFFFGVILNVNIFFIRMISWTMFLANFKSEWFLTVPIFIVFYFQLVSWLMTWLFHEPCFGAIWN